MTITAGGRIATATERQGMLRDLARSWTGEWEQEATLYDIVHDSMSEPLAAHCTCGICLSCSWDAYRWDLALAEGLEGEPGATPYTPDDIGEGLGFDQARDEIWMRVASLEDLLLRGVGAR